MVISGFECPVIFCAVSTSTLASKSKVQNVWRRSCVTPKRLRSGSFRSERRPCRMTGSSLSRFSIALLYAVHAVFYAASVATLLQQRGAHIVADLQATEKYGEHWYSTHRTLRRRCTEHGVPALKVQGTTHVDSVVLPANVLPAKGASASPRRSPAYNISIARWPAQCAAQFVEMRAISHFSSILCVPAPACCQHRPSAGLNWMILFISVSLKMRFVVPRSMSTNDLDISEYLPANACRCAGRMVSIVIFPRAPASLRSLVITNTFCLYPARWS